MTRKEKFLKVIKDKGYDSVVDLMIAVENAILDNKEEARKKATTNKNYYAMIDGKERDFPREYIIALEKVLDMKFIDMIDPNAEDKREFQYDSLRSIAFTNDYDKTKAFALKTANDEQIIYNSDEYDKYFIDYIIEYKAINCFRYLVEADKIRLGLSGHLSSENERHYLLSYHDSKKLPIEIAKLIYEFDDCNLFNTIFNPFSMIRYSSYDNKNIYEDEEFAIGILNTKKILESLFEVKELDVSEVNSLHDSTLNRKGKYANMLLNTILKVGMNEPDKYEKVLLRVLNKAYHINKGIVDFLKQYEDPFIIDDKGFVKNSWIVYGQVVKYALPLLSETPSAVRDALEFIDRPLKELEVKESRVNGRRIFKVKDGKVCVTASNNDIQYEMMKYMNKKQFTYIPHFYEHNVENNTDTFEFRKPVENTIFYTISKEKVADIALFLRNFHKLSEEKLGKGKVYLHNALLYSSCSFSKDSLDAVIDWNNCSVGNPLSDILFVLFEWTGMTTGNRYKEEVLEKISTFIDNYELDKTIKIGDELTTYLNSKLSSLDRESYSYEDKFEDIKRALIFIELNLEKLNERSF